MLFTLLSRRVKSFKVSDSDRFLHLLCYLSAGVLVCLHVWVPMPGNESFDYGSKARLASVVKEVRKEGISTTHCNTSAYSVEAHTASRDRHWYTKLMVTHTHTHHTHTHTLAHPTITPHYHHTNTSAYSLKHTQKHLQTHTTIRHRTHTWNLTIPVDSEG